MTERADIVVVGAGAAGLAAAASLRGRADVRVLEAAHVPGGRARTDRTTLGVPFDLGCHWLHDAQDNPFTAIADRLGFSIGRGIPRPRLLFHDGAMAPPAEADAAHAAVEQAFEAVRAAGLDGRDVAAEAVLPDLHAWAGLARHSLALMSAAAPADISTRDYALYRDSDANWPVLDGYGDLVLAHAAGVPVETGCPVTGIDRRGRDLRLETPRGTLTARVAIVTVSTAALARLPLTPDLPDLRAACAALPLGIAEKVAVLFDRDVFGVDPRTAIDILPGAGLPPVSAVLAPAGAPAAILHVAGPAAADLVAAGPAALTAACLETLAAAFGADILRHVTRTRATGWAMDPAIGGAYSCALPGLAHMRTRLAAGSGDPRLLLAGEAVAGAAFSTCHGAHLSGLAAAEAALRQLGEGSDA